MLIRTPQGLVIIDFKTDCVTPGQVTQRAELYRRQLDYYSRATSAVLKSESITKWLYFLIPRISKEV
jgi:ATP-dependent exoDNAse (exonuclease V) beta subunit